MVPGVTDAGYVQLYFGMTPGILVDPWMRDFTTCDTLSIQECKKERECRSTYIKSGYKKNQQAHGTRLNTKRDLRCV